jgi:hypothetical protein
MKSGNEQDVKQAVQEMLDSLAPGRFHCVYRKSAGKSVIDKPVDLEIRTSTSPQRTLLAIEVANVNATQLVNETCRLYFDSCPLKLLVLGDRNVPRNGVEKCERLMARLYGQDDIENTPARVIRYDDDENLKIALKELLLL